MSAFSYLSLTIFLLCMTLGVAVYSMNRKDPLNRAFVLLCLFWGAYAFTEFHYRSAADFFRADTWLTVEKFFWPLAIASILYFALMYTESWRFLKRRISYLVIFGPALAVSLVDSQTRWITEAPKIYWWGFAAPSHDSSVFFWLAYVWASSAATAAVVICWRYWRRMDEPLKRKQTRLMFVALSAPVAFGILQELWATFYPHVPEVVTISGAWMAIVIGYAIKKYDLFTLSTARVADLIISSVSDSLILLERGHRIQMVNAATVKMLGYSRESELVGRSIEDVLICTQPGAKCTLAPENFDQTNGDWEACFRSSEGEAVPVMLSSSVVKDRVGSQVGTVLVARDITERKRADETIRHMAYYDSLTDLPNRTLFVDRLRQALTTAERNKTRVALFFLDLDGFKHVNDSLGHQTGDTLLRAVAARLSEHLRESDTIARLGGDEFAVIQTNFDGVRDVGFLADKIIRLLSAPFFIAEQEVSTSPSIGIAMYPADHADPEHLLKRADMAMYWAKMRGRHTYQFFNEEMDMEAQKRLNTESGLRHAIEHGEFLLDYQPIVELKTGSLVGAEALVRWNHPQRGIISPAEFIEVSETTGQILPIGEWVLRTACRQIKKWEDEGLRIPVSVNVSVSQLRHYSFVPTINGVLKDTGAEPSLLKLELTESVLMEEAGNAAAIMQELKKLGIGFLLDDFGTGYSSLSYLKWLPVEALKIDRTFVSGLEEDKDLGAIVHAAVTLAHALNMKVVAEGVETGGQMQFLREVGCELAQGYLFGRPLPPDDFARIARERTGTTKAA